MRTPRPSSKSPSIPDRDVEGADRVLTVLCSRVVESACPIDRHLPVEPVRREQDGTSDGVAAPFRQVLRIDISDDPSCPLVQPGRDGVAGHQKDTIRGPVHKVRPGFGRQIEAPVSVGELLAPQLLVVGLQGFAVLVRVFPFWSGKIRAIMTPMKFPAFFAFGMTARSRP